MHPKEIVDQVKHYQRSIEKCWEDEKRMLHCISKLYRLPITVQHLRDTGVGRTVNSLRKFEGGVGDAAKALVAKWKSMVVDEDSSDETDEACVPDAPNSYSPQSPNHDEPSENGSSITNMQDSKERLQNKPSKSGSSSHTSKHSSKNSSSSGVNSNKSEKHSVHKDKHSKSASKEHESKSRKYSSKHDSHSDTRTKSSKGSSKDNEEGHNSKNKSRNEVDAFKVFNNSESVNLKRREESEDDIQPNKRMKYPESQGEVDNAQLVINSSVVSSSSDSDRLGCESLRPVESSQKEENGKDRSDRDKDHSRHKAKTERVKETHKSKDSKSDEKRKSDSHRSSNHSSKSKSSHSSSSSSKVATKHSDSTEDKEKKTKRESKSTECKEKLKKKNKKEKDEDVLGIDSQSGTSFADALGMCTVFPPSRKRIGASSSTSSGKSYKLEAGTSSDIKLVSKESGSDSDSDTQLATQVDLASTLPKISPHYKPLPCNTFNKRYEEDKSLSEVIYTKNQRTKVFSGNKTGFSTVPTLYESCIRVLIDNIDALEVTGGVPYYILKPVLERANPDQLFLLEHHNPYLIEDTDSLWEFHCTREFRTRKREEMESWREMYMRCLDEREAKLKALTANIKQSIIKSAPVRSTIQVHDNIHMKPPRNVLRQQAKYGTAKDLPVTSSELKRKLISGAVKPTPVNICSPSRISKLKTSSMVKKTTAPLMAKALQLVKGRYRR